MITSMKSESRNSLGKQPGNQDRQPQPDARNNTGPQAIYHLQRMVGNRAVGQMVMSGALNPVARKRKVRNDSRDGREPGEHTGRDSGEETFSNEKPVQCSSSNDDKPENSGTHIPGSGGVPLPESTREHMSKRLGGDFSDVRIHHDPAANKAAMDFGAKAFTKGRDIYFANKHFNPDSARGKGLIAHELTHVMQQNAGRLDRAGATGTHQHLERQAENAEQAIQRDEAAHSNEPVPGGVRVQCSIDETLEAMRAIASGGMEAVAQWVIDRLAPTHATIARLAALRAAVQRFRQPLIFQPAEIAVMSRLYQRFVQLAPTWMPVPRMDFTPVVQRNPIIVVGGLALGAAELMLLFLIVILLIWLMLRANPDVREDQDEAVRDFMDAVDRAMRQPRTTTETSPEPEPEPEPRPLGPDIFPVEPEPRRRRRDLLYRWQTPHNYDGRNGRLTYSGGTRPGVNYRDNGHHVWPMSIGGLPSQTLMTVIETIHMEEMHYGRSPVASPVVALAGSVYNYLTNYLNNSSTFGPGGINVLQGRPLTHPGGATSGNPLLVTRMGQGDTTARRLAGSVRNALTEYYMLFQAQSTPAVPRNEFRQGLDDSYNAII